MLWIFCLRFKGDEKVSTYYIKSKFGNLKEIDGVSLQEGVNAFSSLTQISDLLQEGDCVVLLDVKPAVSSADIPAGINVFSGNYVDYWDDNISCKPSGSLSLTLDNMGSETTNSFCNFLLFTSIICNIFFSLL